VTAGSGGSGVTSSSTTSGGTGGGGGCNGLPLCDDFEGAPAGGPPDPARWSVVMPSCSGTGSLAIDDTQAHSGKNSVKVTGKGGYCNHVFFSNASVIGTLHPVIYGRVFLRLSDPLGAGHVTFMAMKDANDGGNDLRTGGQDMVLMWNRQSDDATLPAMSPAGTALSIQPATQQWLCLEFMIDEIQGFMDTWVDGAPIAGLHLDGTPTPDVDQQWIAGKPGWKPNLVDFKLGWESYAGQDMTLWFDDVALGTQRIGCQ
jgi:hypothetical protein